MKHLYESVFSGALLGLLVVTPLPTHAQSMPQAPTPAEAQAALNPAPAQFTNAQLDQMVAPIALYPDQLLTQVLMASTFPDQLVDAQKWLEDPNNASLKGDDLANALQPLPWDPSVKSLAAFPQLIAMMTNHLDWTQALGQAFATQQVQVFARVQFLRERAKNAGTLQSNSQIAVSEQDSDIIIAPANPDMLYVPVYNPADVYGEWPDNDYPPVYIPPPPGFYSGAVGAGIGFSAGLGIVGPLWGWGHPDWRNHRVDINQGRYEHITNQTYIRDNHINIEGGAWHRSAPVTFVPEARRPRPTYQGGEPPHGTVRPSVVFHPGGAPGPRPAGEPGRPNEAAPGPRPAGEPGRPNEAAPGPRPAGEPGRPNEAAPGPRPAGEPGRPNEAAPGPRPAGEPGRPNEAAPGPHPAGQAQPGPRPEEHAAPQGGPPHPEEHAAPQGGPRPAGPPPEAPHPAGPPPQAPHPAGPPPEAPHPAGPPPQAPHPAGPPPQAHPAPPQGHPAPAKPGEEHKDEQH